MSRIGITSDLHLGLTGVATLWNLHRHLASELCDLTVLAGDLGEPLDQFVDCLDIFHCLPGNVAVLAGNHDLWARGRWSSQDLWTREIPQAVQARGMCYLETTEWRAGDLAVLGTIAWYAYSAADPHGTAYTEDDFVIAKRLLNNDARFLKWTWSDPTFASQVGDACIQRLIALEADAAVRDILLITDIPLCESQLVRKPEDEQWGITTAFFGNLTLGGQVLTVPKVRAIISGHTHVGRQGVETRGALPAIPTAVVPSDYGMPGYIIVDTATWEITLHHYAGPNRRGVF